MIIPTGVGARLMKWPWLTFFLLAVNTVVFHFTWENIEDASQQSGEKFGDAIRQDAKWFSAYLLHDCKNRSSLSSVTCELVSTALIDSFLESRSAAKTADQKQNFEKLKAEVSATFYLSLKAPQAFQRAFFEYSQLSTRGGSDVWNQIRKVHRDREVFSAANQNGWAAFKSLFLHGSFSHLIGNMLMLIIFGALLEQKISRPFYLAIYLTGGFLGLLPMVTFSKDSLNFFVGNSGCIAALMGASWFAYRDFKIRCYFMPLFPTPFLARSFMVPVVWSLPLIYFMADVAGFIAGEPGVAFDAHLIGMGVGAVAIFYDSKANEVARPWISNEEIELFQASKLQFIDLRLKTLRHLSLFNFANYKSWSEWARVAMKYKNEVALGQIAPLLSAQIFEQNSQPGAARQWVHVFSEQMDYSGFEMLFSKLPSVEVLGIAELALENDKPAVGFKLLLLPSLKGDLHWVVNTWVRRFKQRKLPQKFKDLAYSELTKISSEMTLPGPFKVFYDLLASERTPNDSRAA